MMHCSESVDSPMDGTQQQQQEKRRRKKPVYNRSNVEIKEFLFKDASAINAKQYRVLIPAMCQKLTHPSKDVKRSKIKGLWDASNKPSDFPPDLQFRDPNNGEKMPLESMKKIFEYFQQKLLQFQEYSEQDSVRTNSSPLTQSKSTDEPSSELQTMIDSNRNAIRVGDEVKEAQNGTIMNEVEMATGDNQIVCCTDAMSFLHELSVPSITSGWIEQYNGGSGLSSNSEEGSWVNSEISGLTCSKGNEVNQSSLIPFTRVDELTDGMDKATWWQNEPDHSETLLGTVLTFHGNTASQCAQLAHEINSDLKEMQTKFISVYKENHEVKSVIDKMNEEFLAPLFEAASNGSLESCLKYSTISTKLQEVMRKAIFLSNDVVIELKKVIDDVESSTPVTHLPVVAYEVEIQNTAMTDPPTDLSTTDDFSDIPEEKLNDIIAVLCESNSVSCNELGIIRNNFTDSVDFNNCSERMEVTTSSEMQVDQLTTCCMTSFEESYKEQQKHGLTEELENEYPKTNCSTPQVIPSTVLEMAESGDSDDHCSKPKRRATNRRGISVRDPQRSIRRKTCSEYSATGTAHVHKRE